jgi:hypothetical protein
MFSKALDSAKGRYRHVSMIGITLKTKKEDVLAVPGHDETANEGLQHYHGLKSDNFGRRRGIRESLIPSEIG